MKRLVTASVTLVFLFAPMAAAAGVPTKAHVHQYTRLYHEAATKFGARAPGRNIIRYGLATRKATDADVQRSIGVLERIFGPPPAITSTGLSAITSSGSCGGITPYAGGGQCWAIPHSIVSCESGGQNVPNTQGSGAMGYYQLMSGGIGSRASQDAAAAALWAGGAGAGNWVCKG